MASVLFKQYPYYLQSQHQCISSNILTISLLFSLHSFASLIKYSQSAAASDGISVPAVLHSTLIALWNIMSKCLGGAPSARLLLIILHVYQSRFSHRVLALSHCLIISMCCVVYKLYM